MCFSCSGSALVIYTVAGDVNFFRTPEERELLFDQLFEDVIFFADRSEPR